MSSGMTTRTLFKNTWYYSSTGFRYGYILVHGPRIEDCGEEEAPPEYELSELLYDFEGQAVISHGYSILVDLVEYVFRGIDEVDLEVFTREELRKLTKIGVVNAYMNAITLPFAKTKHPEVVVDVARENGMRLGIIVDRGTLTRNPYTIILEVDNDRVYYEDELIGDFNSTICRPLRVSDRCILIDARGYGNVLTAIEETYRATGSREMSYMALTNMYRVSGIDKGFVDKGSTSDIIIYDSRNPIKAIPLRTRDDAYTLITRSMQPDIVFIGGDVFYEFGENLAIPVVRVNELLGKTSIKNINHTH